MSFVVRHQQVQKQYLIYTSVYNKGENLDMKGSCNNDIRR